MGFSISSFEGFLQALKRKNVEVQKHVCTLVGYAAKRSGSKINWRRDGKLYWNGEEYDRFGKEYQKLLDRAYEALSENDGFARALLATRNAILTHTIGRRRKKETILTVSEFCGRLMVIRERLQKEAKGK